MREYLLVSKKTKNSVYVCESTIRRRIHRYKNEKTLFVSMCGYGPYGRKSREWEYKTADGLLSELSLFWKYPDRKTQLDALIVKKWDDNTKAWAEPSMEKIIEDVERKIIMDRLMGVTI